MKIKVCGMRDAENISELIKIKPNYIGFIFYSKSKRFVKNFPDIAIPSEIKKIGVFVNEPIDEVLKKIEMYKLDGVQLHGDESPKYCNQLLNSRGKLIKNNLEIFKAFSIDDDFDFSKTTPYLSHCSLFLFDTKGDEYGGNGKKFNWKILEKYKHNKPFLLSGGILKEDANEINKISHKAFAGVDINSGFELKPALKNINYINEFKQNLR